MGIEPITYHLQGGCSTVELRRRAALTLVRGRKALYQRLFAGASPIVEWVEGRE